MRQRSGSTGRWLVRCAATASSRTISCASCAAAAQWPCSSWRRTVCWHPTHGTTNRGRRSRSPGAASTSGIGTLVAVGIQVIGHRTPQPAAAATAACRWRHQTRCRRQRGPVHSRISGARTRRRGACCCAGLRRADENTAASSCSRSMRYRRGVACGGGGGGGSSSRRPLLAAGNAGTDAHSKPVQRVKDCGGGAGGCGWWCWRRRGCRTCVLLQRFRCCSQSRRWRGRR